MIFLLLLSLALERNLTHSRKLSRLKRVAKESPVGAGQAGLRMPRKERTKPTDPVNPVRYKNGRLQISYLGG